MKRALLLGLGALAVPAPATAAEGTLAFLVENDSLTLADRHYSSGLALLWTGRAGWAGRTADALPFLFQQTGETGAGYTLGQALYTPSDIADPVPDPADRPYAGWLFGALDLTRTTPKRLDRLQLSLGVVGPAALGEFSQKLIHRVTGYPEPKGWGSQIDDEPALLVAFQRAWRPLPPARLGGGLEADFAPHATAALGNVLTYAGLGATLRFGPDLPDAFGPPRILPATPGSAAFTPVPGFRWHVFLGAEGRAVARDIFLDGNSFTHSASVDRKPLVGDLQAGLSLAYLNWRLDVTAVLRTKQFDGQKGVDRFGALSIAYSY
ncbi:MAG: lipid A deacylase LpxR family protein [Geminicoccaceae bacterium]|nr:lipid A deacylase LpxR family protein [Geminicoccaceae bacterium]